MSITPATIFHRCRCVVVTGITCIAVVVVTGDKLFTGVVDTGDKFITGSVLSTEACTVLDGGSLLKLVLHLNVSV